MKPTPHGQVAAAFARALVDGDFDKAHGLLTSKARKDWPAGDLRRSFQEMIEYLESPPTRVQVTNEMSDWPGRQPGDIGWAYASIEAEDGAEAVTVVVASEDGRPLVRSIEWGRP
jgi:hypothetical protein